ncbi:HD domain-containing protein [Sulfolobus tengchongensis]|uniref:HD domain-containing protein n=1 Tax=Sulfolobus tengchongensis TaxID=207809 RepID=A0AAX4L1H6_9CREN
MVLRGKLVLPDFEVKFVKWDAEKLKNEIINILVGFENISCELANNEQEIALNIYADMLSLLYKAPMIISHAPYKSSGYYISTAYEYFFTYVILRHLKKIDVNNDLEEILSILEDGRKVLKELFSYVNTLRDIYEALLNTPSDTRPGYNFTSLASHLQLSSILVWLVQQSSVDLNYLRIAALLHDIGKLILPERHVTGSSEILDKVIERSQCLKSYLSRVKEIVEGHHSNLNTILTIADRLAASADRLSKVVEFGLNKENLSIKECYSSKVNSYECIEKHGEKEYSEASKILYKYVLASLQNIEKTIKEEADAKFFEYLKISDDILKATSSFKNEDQKEDEKKKPIGYLAYIDFPGIQKFITNFPNLRDMSFASLLVDFLTTVYSFMLLDNEFSKRGKSRIPAEALLSGYGGHSFIVIRSDITNEDNKEEFIRNIIVNNRELEKLDLKLNVKVVEFAYDNYVRNYNEIWDSIISKQYDRYLVNYTENVYSLGLHRVCDNCGIRPAVDTDENQYLCDRCYLIRKLSKKRGFYARVNSQYMLQNGKTIHSYEFAKKYFGDEYQEYAMEFIAGNKSKEDNKYISLIKADGNRAGFIFKTCATFSDYVDRSFRLDYGIKKAFYETINELAEENEDLASRILSGVLYLGGDDIMILAPSIVAVPFSVTLFSKAEEYTGFTFKVGIISVKPDHPIQFAYRAVNELMESSKIARANKSSLACMVFSSTLATDNVILTEINRYKRKGGDNLMVVSNDLSDVRELLELLKVVLSNSSTSEPNFFKIISNIYNEDNKELVRDSLRPLENLVSYAESNLGTSKYFLGTLAYIITRKAKTEDNYERELINLLLKNLSEKEWNIPLYDYYFIVKSLRVGVGGY